MKQLVGRAYIHSGIPQCELPTKITEKISLCSPESGPRMFIDKEANEQGEHASCVLDIHDIESHLALRWAQAVVATLQIGSQTTLDLFAFWSADDGTIKLQEDGAILWGHYSEELTEEAIEFAREHTMAVESILLPDEYSRVSNAFRIYFEALTFRNADFALLGFIGALESLFSISTQELSFRLSLQLAKFLGANSENQRQFFERAKKLYTTRSKIAHGSKLGASEESAAIEIVGHWTPEAEELTRLSFKRLLEYHLISYFNNKKQHEKLLTELLFAKNLEAAINKVSSK